MRTIGIEFPIKQELLEDITPENQAVAGDLVVCTATYPVGSWNWKSSESPFMGLYIVRGLYSYSEPNETGPHYFCVSPMLTASGHLSFLQGWAFETDDGAGYKKICQPPNERGTPENPKIIQLRRLNIRHLSLPQRQKFVQPVIKEL